MGQGPLWHLPDVPGRAGWPVSRRSHPSAAGREAGVDCTSRAFQFSGAKRPFSEAIAVGMARLAVLIRNFRSETDRDSSTRALLALGSLFYRPTKCLETVVCRSGRMPAIVSQSVSDPREGQGGSRPRA